MIEQKFDVFLCHNSEDKPAVIQIAQQLRQNNLTPWLDVWEIRPGEVWQLVLERQIESIGAAAVFIGKQGIGPWQQQEIYCFLQEFVSRQLPVIPVMLANAPQQPKLPVLLKNIHWVDFRLQDPDPLSQLVWGITGFRALTPYETVQVIDTQTVTAVGAAQTTGLPSVLPPALKDDLVSEKGINYNKLHDLLQAGQWRDADRETRSLIFKIVERYEDAYALKKRDFLTASCADLKMIDRLWLEQSDEQWGFSAQKRIYLECGASLDGKFPGHEILDEFYNHIGWKKGKGCITYSELTSNPLECPAGAFPASIFVGTSYSGSALGSPGKSRLVCGELNSVWGGGKLWDLFLRIDHCEVMEANVEIQRL
ncbi:GUN4 domain-containing protein [Nodosilinea sp. PGN35]|uniref:GUN4 domain-containing protein n=1 Tax=Nodosilinea sp. PGN35 TaxID=3020489 RepID=UPI0023B32022|nr:GUN4 domain-containing protein [Nodosilinea sp. TSF1-S3]MDF0366731.1 GUN4 domain-containing protein [Nodosilinea sp. TSF1-S3]